MHQDTEKCRLQVPILVTPSPFHLIGLESDFEFDQSQDLMEETSAMFGYL